MAPDKSTQKGKLGPLKSVTATAVTAICHVNIAVNTFDENRKTSSMLLLLYSLLIEMQTCSPYYTLIQDLPFLSKHISQHISFQDPAFFLPLLLIIDMQCKAPSRLFEGKNLKLTLVPDVSPGCARAQIDETFPTGFPPYLT